MKKSKITKRALFMSMASISVSCAMLAGSTFAWFTDKATSGTNKIVAGNLDIELKVKDEDGNFQNVKDVEDNSLFNIDKWEPGVVAYETFKAVNVGNLALKYNMYLSFSDVNYVNGTDHSLVDVIKVAFLDKKQIEDENLDISDRDKLIEAVKDKLGYIKGDTRVAEGKLLPKDETNTKDIEGFTSDEKEFIVVAYWEPTDKDNDYNMNNEYNLGDGKKATSDEKDLHVNFGVTLSATQVPYEKDSFDIDYDENAELENVNLEAIKNTINQGAKDSNAAIVKAIQALAEKNGTDLTDVEIEKLVYFDDKLEKNDEGELAITLHFEENSEEYVDVTYAAVKALIGNAVNAQAGNIKSIQIENQPAHVLDGKPIIEKEPGTWVENDLKAIVRALSTETSSLSEALSVAQENGLAVQITSMDNTTQTYRMNFELNW